MARGDGLGAASAMALDPATGERRPLGRAVAGAGSVSFSADGTRTAVAETRASGAASLVPSALGFLVGRVQTALDAAEGAGPGTTVVRVGETGGELGVLALGAAESWGEPSGLSLAPAGDALVLGQRRTLGGAIEERLVWVELDCEPAAP